MKNESIKKLSVCILETAQKRFTDECIRQGLHFADTVFVIRPEAPAEAGPDSTEIPVYSPEAAENAAMSEWILILRPGERIALSSPDKLDRELRGSAAVYGVYIRDFTIADTVRQFEFIRNLNQFENGKIPLTRIEERLVRKERFRRALCELLEPAGGLELQRISEAIRLENTSPGAPSPAADKGNHDRECLKGNIYYGPTPGEDLDELSCGYNGFRILHLGYLEGFLESARKGIGSDLMYHCMFDYLCDNEYFPEAKELYEAWSETREIKASQHLIGGHIYKHLFMLDKAVSCFEKVKLSDPHNIMSDFDILANMGKMYLIRGEKEKAAEVFQQALSARPDKLIAHALDLIRKPDWRPGRISLCMIAKDEAEAIGTCLKSAAGIADEIIVADTGSSDLTRTIVRGRGGRVLDFLWTDDFSAARNAALEEAKGDYILVLDGDEFLKPEHRFELAFLKQIVPAGRDLAFLAAIDPYKPPAFLSVSYLDRLGKGSGSGEQVRLFPRRSEIRYEGRVFESVIPSLERAGIPVAPVQFRVVHKKDKAASREERKRKAVQASFADAGAERIAMDAAVYHIRMGEIGNAAPWVQKSMTADPDLFFRLAKLFSENGFYDESLAVVRKALDLNPGDARLNSVLAGIYFKKSEHAKVLEALSDLDFQDPAFSRAETADLYYMSGVSGLHEERDVPEAVGRVARALEADWHDLRYRTAGLLAFAVSEHWEEFIRAAGDIAVEAGVRMKVENFGDIGFMVLRFLNHFAAAGKEDEAGSCRRILEHLMRTGRIPVRDMEGMLGGISPVHPRQ
jgi:glycosyltransferase involved in cell wall biosynthesis